MNMQLTSLDILYLSLSIGFLILVGVISYLVFRVSRTLGNVDTLVEDVDDTAKDIRGLKNHVKGGVFGAVSPVLGLVANIKRR